MGNKIIFACAVIVLFSIPHSAVASPLKHHNFFASGLSSDFAKRVSLRNLPGLDSGQQAPHQQQTEINYGRLALLGGLYTGAIVAIHLYQQSGWWKDNRTTFHFQEDLVYGLNVDKIGHFYGSTLLTFAFRNALESADVPEKKSVYIGATGALLFQTYVEIEDGFSTWGFDRVDFASDLGGALWPILQYEVPALQNYELKFSYVPSDLLNRPGGTGFKGQKHIIIDDYEGQTFWLSAKMRNILPESAARYWPSFLCLSVGYGARDIAGIKANPYRVYYVALDYDFTKIIPDSTPLLRDIAKTLNFVHFPAPTIQISPNAIWYGLFF
jgi:hypothetical protein